MVLAESYQMGDQPVGNWRKFELPEHGGERNQLSITTPNGLVNKLVNYIFN